jgi:hypothetical protein
MTILEQLADLLRKVTIDRSPEDRTNFYVASTCRAATAEIVRLQIEVKRLSEFEWMYNDLCR